MTYPPAKLFHFTATVNFYDLCAGSHVSYTKKIKAFKLLNIAGSYHRGDSSQKQLQRIYGTAFASKDELSQYLQRIEEAKLRDHRVVGKDLGLFHIDEQVGQGLVLWKPNGAIIRQELEGFITEQLNIKATPKSTLHILENLTSTEHLVTFPTIRILNILQLYIENASKN